MARKALGAATLRVRQAVEAGWPDGEPALVACSGGPDSLALAIVAGLVAHRRGAGLAAVVVDHRLQEGSDRVAAQVVEQLAGHGLAAEIRTVDVSAGPGAGGPESAARDARYAALAEAAREYGACVLLGHTLDDQAETVLLGLARGSGARSLAGMPAHRGPFRRPLLGLRRADTVAACTELGLTPWHDPHNRDRGFARARVRAVALPVLEEQLGPGVAESLARTAGLLRDDADLLDRLADEAYAAVADSAGPACAALAGLPPALLRRVLRRYLLDRGGSDLTSTHLAAVARLVTDWHGQAGVDVPGLRVARRDGRLVAAPARGVAG